MMEIPKTHPIRRWFAGLVEEAFQQELGLCDARILEYLTDLLTAFLHMEQINTAPDGSGRRIEEVAQMLSEVELVGATVSNDDRRRVFHRHIGDFTLFWTGVYPEQLRRMHHHGTADELLNYFAQGKRSYAIASDLSNDLTVPAAAVLREMSEHFEYCVYGLGLVRRHWEDSGKAGSRALL